MKNTRIFILEKCIKVRLVSYIVSINLIDPSQFGFQSGKSTQDAILFLIEKIYDNLNNSTSTLAVFIDAAKAFDTVNLSILLGKARKCGIVGKPLDLLTSYLSERSQAVKIGNAVSDFKEIVMGVPQGSVLGPILFLIYVNDMPLISNLFSSCLFCDDTTLIFENSNIDDLFDAGNRGLEVFAEWCNSNRLSVNVLKTNSMLFTNAKVNNSQIPNVLLNGSNITQCSSVQFLGVTIDENLKFNIHINNITRKISKNIGILYKLRYFVPTKTLISIYHSFIGSYLNYCPLVFGNAYSSHLYPLEVAQRKCIRVISNVNPLAHSDPLFSQLNLLKFCDVYKLNLGIYMFKYNDRFLASANMHNYSTRFSSTGYLTSFNRLTLTRNQSLSFQVPNNWNGIPDNIKNSQSLDVFKREYKKYLISLYSSS